MKSARFFKNQKGFTLIELLVVIGILAILLSIVLIAINPARQFGQANDTKRRSAVTQVLNAIGAYAAENKGNLPTQIPDSVAGALPICKDTATPANCADLCAVLVPDYIPALPTDPSLNTNDVAVCTADYQTNYTVVKDSATNRVTVAAPDAEISTPIEITR